MMVGWRRGQPSGCRQPHTSAGRVPTAGGYRFFVDHCSPARLRSATRARIESFFADVHQELGKLLQDTSALLSDVSHYPAVVIGPGFGSEEVRGVHLVHLGAAVLLAVSVSESGRVSQEIVRLDFDPSDSDLDEAEMILERVYSGKSVEDGVTDIAALDRSAIPVNLINAQPNVSFDRIVTGRRLRPLVVDHRRRRSRLPIFGWPAGAMLSLKNQWSVIPVSITATRVPSPVLCSRASELLIELRAGC